MATGEKESGGSRTRRCVSCGERAEFITPLGMMCRSEAMKAAMEQQGEDRWMPVPLNPGGSE
jgi:ribosomal protein S14